MKKTVYLLSFTLFCSLVVIFFMGKRLYWYMPHGTKTVTVTMNRDSLYYQQRKHLYEVYPRDSGNVVFFGNSLTQGFDLQELFPGSRFHNRGIGGDTTEGLLQRITTIIQLQPSKLFIEIGINDLSHSIKPDSILQHYVLTIDTMQKESPKTKIFIQSILPVSTYSGTGFYGRDSVNKEIVSVNNSLQQMAETKHCTYIDLYSHFSLNGTANPAYFIADGVHLKGEGYLLWRDILKPYVNSNSRNYLLP